MGKGRKWSRPPQALLAVLVVALLGAETAGAARSWQSPIRVSPADQEVVSYDGMLSSAGEVVALWNESRSPELPTVRAAIKPSGQPFGPIQDLGIKGFGPTLTGDGLGNILAAWEYEPPVGGYQTRQRILVSRRAPGGSFGTPVDVGQGQGGIALAANARGDAVVFWTRYANGGKRLFTSVRPAGGSWSAEQDVSGFIPSIYISYELDVAMTPAGEAIYVWQDRVDTGDEVASVKLSTRSPAGILTPAVTLSRADRRAIAARIEADAAGRAAITWTEMLAGYNGGPVMGTVRDAAGIIQPARELGGQAYDWGGADLAVSPDGDAIASWGEYTPRAGGGGHLGPVKVALGTTTLGFQPSSNLSPSIGEWPSVALSPAGEALAVYSDWDQAELHAVRRPRGGLWSSPLTLVCPRPLAYPHALGIDGTATASILWKQVNAMVPKRGLFLSQDQETVEPGPARCPARGPAYTITPNPARPGETITIDGSGAKQDEAPVNEWSWDLDNNGDFEVGPSTDPKVTTSFDKPGRYTIRMKVFSDSTTGSSGSSIWNIELNVTDDSAPPPPDPGQGHEPPTSSTVPGVTPAGGGEPPPGGGGQPPGGGAPAPATAPEALTVGVPAEVDLHRALRRGILAVLRSTHRRDVSMRLLLDRATRRRLTASGSRLIAEVARVKLRPFQDTKVRLRIKKRAQRALRRLKSVRVTLEIRSGAAVVKQERLTMRRARGSR